LLNMNEFQSLKKKKQFEGNKDTIFMSGDGDGDEGDNKSLHESTSKSVCESVHDEASKETVNERVAGSVSISDTTNSTNISNISESGIEIDTIS
jgi:response regulator of citrate/malate metabolism